MEYESEDPTPHKSFIKDKGKSIARATMQEIMNDSWCFLQLLMWGYPREIVAYRVSCTSAD